MLYRLLLIFGLALTVNPLSALEAINFTTATGNLPGRFDYVSIGGDVTLAVSTPPSTSVQWFRDNERVTTTLGGSLELSALQVADTGNYHAQWTVDDKTYESSILSLNVGVFPASSLDDPNVSAGVAIATGNTELDRLLPDGRIVASTFRYAGAGGNRSHFLLSEDLSVKTTIYNWSIFVPGLESVLNDGSYFLSEAPYRYSGSGEALPFQLPTELSGDYIYFDGPVNRGANSLLFTKEESITGTQLDGTIEFHITADQLGFGSIEGALVASDNSLFVHGRYADSVGGATIRLIIRGSDRSIDSTFGPILNETSKTTAVRLNDGSWARITGSHYERYDSAGKFIDRRFFEKSAWFHQLAPSGDVYRYSHGLGIMRYRALDLRRDSEFFVPQYQFQSDSLDSVRLRLVLERADGSAIVVTKQNPTEQFRALSNFNLASAIPHQAESIPVISRIPHIRVPIGNTGEFEYVSYSKSSSHAPRSGDAFRLQCDYFGTGTMNARWIPLDGTPSPAETSDGSLDIPVFSLTYAGRYQLIVSNELGQSLGPIVDFGPNTRPMLTNLSGRAQVDSGDSRAIAGFVIRRSPTGILSDRNSTKILVRGIGPTLADFGVASPLLDPAIKLLDAQTNLLAFNDNWGGNVSTGTLNRLGAFTPSTTSRDATLHEFIGAGSYTAITETKSAQKGIALTEIYLDRQTFPPAFELANLSLRGTSGNGDLALTGGFVIEDPQNLNRPLRVLIRAIGPTLNSFNVSPALADPILQVFNTQGDLIARNNDWGKSADADEITAIGARLGAFELDPSSLDSALLLSLSPGAYTAQVQRGGLFNAIALLEIYVVTD